MDTKVIKFFPKRGRKLCRCVFFETASVFWEKNETYKSPFNNRLEKIAFEFLLCLYAAPCNHRWAQASELYNYFVAT